MVQHFLLGPSRDTDEARELFVPKSSKPLGNIRWGGTRSVTQLANEPEVAPDARAFNQIVDAKFHSLRTLPCNNLAEIFPPSHAERESKFRTRTETECSGLKLEGRLG
jgi:hypothetical protein